MIPRPTLNDTDIQYLKLLAHEFPTQAETFTEIINLQAILNLPKSTEHFMSDLHGEYEAFLHILNNASGVIREKVDKMFFDMTDEQQNELLTLIYYPKEKLDRMEARAPLTEAWCKQTLLNLLSLARLLSTKYSRSKVRNAMNDVFRYVIDELLHAQPDKEYVQDNKNKYFYHAKILDSIWETGAFRPFVYSLTNLIKRLAVDHLHIVGDIFDRGAYPHKIMDRLMQHHSVDIQWGNHDVLWMGAAAGSVPCILNAVRNNVRYSNWEVLENGYGISMRKFSLFANEKYKLPEKKRPLERAINVLLFKAEGQAILRHPEYNMRDRLLFDKMDIDAGTVQLPYGTFALNTHDFPTYDPKDPYAFTPEEQKIVDNWVRDFRNSELLQKHIKFLLSHGSVYKIMNGNLMFHGGVPLTKEGEFREVTVRGETHHGQAYMDYIDTLCRQSFRRRNQDDLDFFWFLWINPDSPVSGRMIKTFERSYIDDKSTWPEPQDAYYKLHRQKRICDKILHEFGLDSPLSHIINGHTPVKDGDEPVRADGREICIDGGFCKAYHKTTGKSGYTLIFNSHSLRIKAHTAFTSIQDVLDNNGDIDSKTKKTINEPHRLLVADTDGGKRLKRRIHGLQKLLWAYRDGIIQEHPERSRIVDK